MKFSRLLSCVAATVALGMGATAASAATISIGSEMGWIGNFSPTGGAGLGTATGVDIDPSLVIIGSDDLAGQVGGMITFDSLALDGSSPVGALFTTAGGLSFTLTSITVALQTPEALDFSATGILSLAGFDDTQAVMTWTGDADGGLNTYSAAVRVVPVPGAVWLFASALAMLGLRRKT